MLCMLRSVAPLASTLRMIASRHSIEVLAIVLRMLVVACLLPSCASHSATTRTARDSLDRGDANAALSFYNKQLGTRSGAEQPVNVSGDTGLLLLDRSMVLQQVGALKSASADLELAEKQLELLEFSSTAGNELGTYLFSDDTAPYRAPAYEKLLVNTMNMVNYLARGDLKGARVEARRLAVIQDYFKQEGNPGEELLGIGSYLAGFTFEKSNRPQSALRYYDEALHASDFSSLHEAVRRMATRANYRTPRITQVLSRAPARQDSFNVDDTAPAELLVVVNYGRVPVKVARRLPIGLALSQAGHFVRPGQVRLAREMTAQGAVTWVNFPSLPQPTERYKEPIVSVGGKRLKVNITNVGELTVTAWKKVRARVIAAAITRLIARYTTGKAIKKVAGKKSGLGALLSILAQAGLTAADTPDTRSWSTLPARIAVARVVLAPGTHSVELSVRGVKKKQTIQLQPGGWATVLLTELR